eukprot:GHVT01097218.1.p1 GENE.GHVT01097218.1~~GHVT01097218.1.p1  ORF type:complete len:123 (-),score=26.16 GHVT01097218.1:1313-1681(-)
MKYCSGLAACWWGAAMFLASGAAEGSLALGLSRYVSGSSEEVTEKVTEEVTEDVSEDPWDALDTLDSLDSLDAEEMEEESADPEFLEPFPNDESSLENDEAEKPLEMVSRQAKSQQTSRPLQ